MALGLPQDLSLSLALPVGDSEWSPWLKPPGRPSRPEEPQDSSHCHAGLSGEQNSWMTKETAGSASTVHQGLRIVRERERDREDPGLIRGLI